MVRGPVASPSVAEQGESLLGRGVRVRGRVNGDGDLRVEGSVEGELVISGGLTIEEGASVKGDVGASSVVVAGVLAGDVDSRGPVVIRATAKVEGNLGAAEVSIEEGASFAGRLEAEFELPEEPRPAPVAGAPLRGR